MNRIYEKLKGNKNFKDKLIFDEIKNCLTITFHEYLRLEYFEGNYTACYDEGLINFYYGSFNNAGHQHIQDDEEALETVIGFSNGNEIFIEDTSRFSLVKLRVLEKKNFEKKKEKYMAKKSLRIYSGNSIIKRSAE